MKFKFMRGANPMFGRKCQIKLQLARQQTPTEFSVVVTNWGSSGAVFRISSVPVSQIKLTLAEAAEHLKYTERSIQLSSHDAPPLELGCKRGSTRY